MQTQYLTKPKYFPKSNDIYELILAFDELEIDPESAYGDYLSHLSDDQYDNRMPYHEFLDEFLHYQYEVPYYMGSEMNRFVYRIHGAAYDEWMETYCPNYKDKQRALYGL